MSAHHYRVWDGVGTEYIAMLSESEVIELRHSGYYVQRID